MANRDSAAKRVEPIRKPDEYGGRKSNKSYERPNIVMRQSEGRKGSALSILFVSIFVAALLSSVIYSLDRKNELYNQISAKKTELEELEAENIRLQSERDSNMTLKNVEEYAEDVLGMQKLDKSQIEYIQIQTEDVVKIPAVKENMWIKIKNMFTDCVEYLRG